MSNDLSHNSHREFFYDSIADDFDAFMNIYDLQRRLSAVFESCLANKQMTGKTVLDAGCGTGAFSVLAEQRGAKVIGVDIGRRLVSLTKKKSSSAEVVCASLEKLPFRDNYFDYVISSEVLEHTAKPEKCLIELIRVLKPGGYLTVTIPNRSIWYPAMLLANGLGIRKYKGFENWIGFFKFRSMLKSSGLEIEHYFGIHCYPFTSNIVWNKVLLALDRSLGKILKPLMVNIVAGATKL